MTTMSLLSELFSSLPSLVEEPSENNSLNKRRGKNKDKKNSADIVAEMSLQSCNNDTKSVAEENHQTIGNGDTRPHDGSENCIGSEAGKQLNQKSGHDHMNILNQRLSSLATLFASPPDLVSAKASQLSKSLNVPLMCENLSDSSIESKQEEILCQFPLHSFSRIFEVSNQVSSRNCAVNLRATDEDVKVQRCTTIPKLTDELPLDIRVSSSVNPVCDAMVKKDENVLQRNQLATLFASRPPLVDVEKRITLSGDSTSPGVASCIINQSHEANCLINGKRSSADLVVCHLPNKKFKKRKRHDYVDYDKQSANLSHVAPDALNQWPGSSNCRPTNTSPQERTQLGYEELYLPMSGRKHLSRCPPSIKNNRSRFKSGKGVKCPPDGFNSGNPRFPQPHLFPVPDVASSRDPFESLQSPPSAANIAQRFELPTRSGNIPPQFGAPAVTNINQFRPPCGTGVAQQFRPPPGTSGNIPPHFMNRSIASSQQPNFISGFLDPNVAANEKQAIFEKAPPKPELEGEKKKKKKNRGAAARLKRSEKAKLYREKERLRLEREKAMLESRSTETRKPCRFFEQGKCNKTDCSYSHDFIRVKQQLVCKYYVMDSCEKGSDCMFMHSEWPCKFFHLDGRCSFEARCKFSHDPITDVTQPLLDKIIHERASIRPMPLIQESANQICSNHTAESELASNQISAIQPRSNPLNVRYLSNGVAPDTVHSDNSAVPAVVYSLSLITTSPAWRPTLPPHIDSDNPQLASDPRIHKYIGGTGRNQPCVSSWPRAEFMSQPANIPWYSIKYYTERSEQDVCRASNGEIYSTVKVETEIDGDFKPMAVVAARHFSMPVLKMPARSCVVGKAKPSGNLITKDKTYDGVVMKVEQE